MPAKITVFNLLCDWAVDFDCSDAPSVTTYADPNKAIDAFMVEVHSAQKDSEDFQNLKETYTNLDREINDKYYAVYSEGEWSCNHIQIQLIKQEVEYNPGSILDYVAEKMEEK